MDKLKFSPAPWKIDLCAEVAGHGLGVFDADGRVIALPLMVGPAVLSLEPKEGVSNGVLMAAAPEMLEALQLQEEYDALDGYYETLYQFRMRNNIPKNQETRAWIANKRRAAIAKVIGDNA